MSFYRLTLMVVRFAASFAYRIRVIEPAVLPEGKGCIVAANHQCHLDPLFVAMACPAQVRFMAKKELFDRPLQGRIFKALGAFPVERGSGDRQALNRAAEIVKNGQVLGIFPEGTRSKTGKLLRAKSGVTVIASQTGGDIIPVGIRICGRKLWRKCVEIRCGEPITNESIRIENFSKAELKEANHLLMTRIAEMSGKEYEY